MKPDRVLQPMDLKLYPYFLPPLPTGEILFHNELKKMEVSIDEAKKLIITAIETLENESPNKKCEWCKWI
jgi:hypothetical protein